MYAYQGFPTSTPSENCPVFEGGMPGSVPTRHVEGSKVLEIVRTVDDGYDAKFQYTYYEDGQKVKSGHFWALGSCGGTKEKEFINMSNQLVRRFF